MLSSPVLGQRPCKEGGGKGGVGQVKSAIAHHLMGWLGGFGVVARVRRRRCWVFGLRSALCHPRTDMEGWTAGGSPGELQLHLLPRSHGHGGWLRSHPGQWDHDNT